MRKESTGNPTIEKIIELIKYERKHKNITLRQLEASCGVHNGHISQILSNKVKEPSFSLIMRICEGVGISFVIAADLHPEKIPELLSKKISKTN